MSKGAHARAGGGTANRRRVKIGGQSGWFVGTGVLRAEEPDASEECAGYRRMNHEQDRLWSAWGVIVTLCIGVDGETRAQLEPECAK
jgi:hypothetical protein